MCDQSIFENIQDVFFETENTAHLNKTSLLYRLMPYGVGTNMCESLNSYFTRLAHAHRISPATLSDFLTKEFDTTTDYWRTGTSGRDKVLRYNSIGKISNNLVEILSKKTGVDELLFCTMLPMLNILSTYNLIAHAERHCPMCLMNYPVTYSPLIWSVASVTACPIHGTKLVPTICGAPMEKHLSQITRKFLAGICSKCGSVGFRCRKDKILAATDVELWKANQVAELISSFPRAHILFSKQNTIDGLIGLVGILSKGQAAIAARKIGMPKSVLWSWMHGANLPSLKTLLELCLAAELSLVSVLQGCPSSCASPIFIPKAIRPRKQKPTNDERELALKAALKAQHPISITSISKKLGLDPSILRKQFPELHDQLVERYSKLIAIIRAQRYSKMKIQAEELIDQLQVKGITLTKRNFLAACEHSLYPNNRFRIILDSVLADRGLPILGRIR